MLAVIAYDALARPRMLEWGSTAQERRQPLPGDDIIDVVMTHCTRAVTIDAPPEAVWPWLVQIGDRRAGFYSYDWVERFVVGGTVHYIERTQSATRVHPELQDVQLGDRINTGSVGRLAIGNPVTVLEPDHALVIGTWAFVLEPPPGQRTRLLVRERDAGWLRLLAPRRFGLARAAASLVDYVVAEPLHFAMVHKMMLGLKQRAEQARARPRSPSRRR
jgi:hypothetical protein